MFSTGSNSATGRPRSRSLAMLGILGLMSTGVVVSHAPSAFAVGCSAGSTTTYAGGDGSEGDPYQISTAEELILLSEKSNDVGETYADTYFKQTAHIDLADCAFTPIGQSSNAFEGTYDGANFDVEGLAVDEDQAGLFAQLASDGTITRVSIKGGTVTGEILGGLVGKNFGTITDSSSSASVEGRDADGSAIAGGLVGENESVGVIENSSASGTVLFEDYSEPRKVGGFVGKNAGTITGSSASGDARVVTDEDDDNDAAGGFVGWNTSTGLIQESQASGDASSPRDNAGGFVGVNDGTIEDSSASGAVVADNDHAGGFAGFNSEDAEITDSFAVGVVTGDSEVGGFVGENNGGTIEGSHSTGRVIAGDTEAGGFVGFNDDEGSGEITNSYATGRVSGNDEVGGFVGENEGKIEDSHATGQVNALLLDDPDGNDGGFEAGGFAGFNDDDGTISNSYATGPVETVNDRAGGFVGYNEGTISNASASGTAAAGGDFAGGFVARNAAVGSISYSYARGDASSIGKSSGGFVGSNTGTVEGSYATGDATSNADKAGGFVGDNGSAGDISDSYATGNAEATVEEAGGFAGDSSGTISRSYSIGTATAPSGVGGFLGKDDGTTEDSFWDITTSGLTDSDGGLGDNTDQATGKTTSEMTAIVTFNDTGTAGLGTAWGIIAASSFGAPDGTSAEIWGIGSDVNCGYPFLHWQDQSGHVCVVPDSGSGNTGRDDDDDSVAPVETVTPGVATARSRATEVAPPRPVDGPVLRGGVVAAPPRGATVSVGGVPTIVEESSPDPTTLSVLAGSLSVDVSVDEAAGEVSRFDDGVIRLSVKAGSAAVMRGTGLQSGANVQVFIPLSPDDSREVANLTVAADGTFSGELPVSTDPLAEPLPIGERLLQLVSVDADGNQVVLEMAVNVAQGDPAPALDRDAGDIPVVEPGATAVTSAGVVTEATTTALPDQNIAVVEGDTWSMAVTIDSEQGGVEPSESGALVTLVRDEVAQVSGVGFMAGTRADVWLFSEPALLGTVTIDENGEFSGEVGIDPDLIPTGEHTLQLQGVGQDGYVKAANMGVFVDDAQPELAVAEQDGLDLSFIWWILAAIVLVAIVVAIWVRRSRRA